MTSKAFKEIFPLDTSDDTVSDLSGTLFPGFVASISDLELTQVKTSKTTRGSALMMKEWVRKKTTESLNKIRKFATLLISNVY